MKSSLEMLRRISRWLNPLAWLNKLRRSLTAASVMLVLIAIVSMNIVWGYPWLGMLAACVSMLLVGGLLNYFGKPNLQAIANVPRHVPVGEEIGIPIRLVNIGRWPGIDLNIERSHPVPFLAPSAETSILQMVRFGRRGERSLPSVLVESYFPFHLFRSRHWVDPATTITATPRRLLTEVDDQWRNLEEMLKGIASRAARGDQIHYVGNREYREGVPVRRWDFASWARIGKPVLREYSSPSSKTVLVVVDNSWSSNLRDRARGSSSADRASFWDRIRGGLVAGRSSSDEFDESFERLLSLASSSIESLSRNGASVSLQFVSGNTNGDVGRKYFCEAGADPGDLLIALGNVSICQATSLNDQDGLRLDDNGRSSDNEAVIILSCRDQESFARLRQSASFRSLSSNKALWVNQAGVVSGVSGAMAGKSFTPEKVGV